MPVLWIKSVKRCLKIEINRKRAKLESSIPLELDFGFQEHDLYKLKEV